MVLDGAAGLALGSAGFLALALILARLGLRARPVIAAAATSVPTATVLMWLAAPLALDMARFDPIAALIFAGCGVLFPIGQTLLSFETNRRMGPALAGALGNVTPLFALGFAALILGEDVTPWRGAGAVVLIFLRTIRATIIAGVALLSLRGGTGQRDWPLWVLMLPVASAVIRSIAQTGVKAGLALWPSAFAASLVGYTVSSAVILTLRARRQVAPVPWREHGMFMLVGVCNATAVMLMYAALSQGAVGVVAPLVATYPLFTLGLSALMLRDEQIHARLLGGVAVTVAGVVLVLVG